MNVPPEAIDRWQEAFEGTLIAFVGLRILEASRDRVVAEMPFRDDLCQVTGIFHAGAIITLADTTATALANIHTQPTPDEFDPALFPLTIQLGVNLIHNAKTSRLVAEAVPVHVGRRVLVVRTDVRDTDGRLFATVTNTLVPASSREADAGRREKSE